MLPFNSSVEVVSSETEAAEYIKDATIDEILSNIQLRNRDLAYDVAINFKVAD